MYYVISLWKKWTVSLGAADFKSSLPYSDIWIPPIIYKVVLLMLTVKENLFLTNLFLSLL